MTAVDTPALPSWFGLETTEPARPSQLRLTTVEVRKMIDTRAGFWLLTVIALGMVATAFALLHWTEPQDAGLSGLFESLNVPVVLLLPILGILTVTGEWTHRSALPTFTLVPHRLRVVTAKIVAAVVLSVAVGALALVAAALANLVSPLLGPGGGSWSISVGLLAQYLLWDALSVLMGVGFGMLLGSSALAICLYFLIPNGWLVALEFIGPLKGRGAWVSVDPALAAVSDHAGELVSWAQLGTSTALWIGLPLALGSYRLLHREVK